MLGNGIVRCPVLISTTCAFVRGFSTPQTLRIPVTKAGGEDIERGVRREVLRGLGVWRQEVPHMEVQKIRFGGAKVMFHVIQLFMI